MACALALGLLVPMVSANGPVTDAVDAVEDGTGVDAREETRSVFWRVMDAFQDAQEEAAEEANAAAAAAQARIDAILGLAGDTLDGAASQINDIKGDAENQVPEIHKVWGEREVGPAYAEPQEYTPSATVSEPMGFAQPLAIVGATAAAATLLFWLAGSTSAAKAGAATASTSEMRRLLPFASPLFTRFERDTVLGHPKREALYGRIMTKPGVTLQDLCEETGLSRTAVSHHLRLLEQQHLIVSKRMGRSRHFFENGGRYGRDQKEAYAVLHNDRSKDVHSYIESHPGAIQKDLCTALDIQASVAHWHVKRLQEAELIEAVRQGRTVSYFPTTALA